MSKAVYLGVPWCTLVYLGVVKLVLFHAFIIDIKNLSSAIHYIDDNSDDVSMFMDDTRLWHGNEARMLFSRLILVFNYQTDMFLCLIFAKIAK